MSQTSLMINGRTYSYTAHPRVWFDGPSGPITTSLKDPDGLGPATAPKSRQIPTVNQALLDRIRTHVSSCTSSAGPCNDPGGDRRELFASLAALDWFMDNTQIKSRNYAVWQLNTIETINSRYQFGCIEQVDACGLNSWNDWPSEKMLYTALAYTLIRSELSSADRRLFADKMLNGILGDSCTNQFQLVPAATVNYVSGSSTITGTGMGAAGLTNGQMVYVMNPGTVGGLFGYVESVNADSSISLKERLTNALDDDTTTNVSQGLLYKLNAWGSGSCGQLWQVAHHPYNPSRISQVANSSALAARFSATDTSIFVTDPSVFPAAAPFYVHTPKDRMKVTAVNGNRLTVERGQFNTTPSAWASVTSGWVGYLPFPRGGGRSSNSVHHNLVFQKLHGYLMIAMALLDDDARAQTVLDWNVRDYEEAMPTLKELWTGLSQGGSGSYGLGRWTTNNAAILAALRTMSLDYSAGDWMKQYAHYRLYFSLPDARKSNVPWGESSESSVNYNSHKWIAAFQHMYAGTEEAQFSRYWEWDYTGSYTTSNLVANPHTIPWYLVFASDSDQRRDFSSLPTQRTFNNTDVPSDKALGAWISRTGWLGTTDTVVAAFALGTYAGDHVVQGTSNPGSYKIYKQGWTMTEDSTSNSSYGTRSNILQVGNDTDVNMKGASTTNWQNVPIDRSAADNQQSSWAYSRVNLTEAYTANAKVTRAFRHFVHFKKPGYADYVLAYDNVASTAGVQKAIWLHYDLASKETSSMSSSTLPNLVWTGPNRSLSTKVLLPQGAAAFSGMTTTANSYAFRVCASTTGTNCDSSNTEAEFLVAHRPSSSAGTFMAPISLIQSSAQFACSQISDNYAYVACFARGEVAPIGLTFTSTHSGVAQVVIAGLAPGKYTVGRLGNSLETYTVKSSEGVIAFEGQSGSYSITPVSQIL